MWYAAGAESSVVPHVLKTILLILKGKPREMEKITERKHFSLNTTNMMPVAVINTMSNVVIVFLIMKIPICPQTQSYFLDTVWLSFIHSYTQCTSMVTKLTLL